MPPTGGAGAGSGAVEVKQFDDGGVYEGTFKDGKMHGTGHLQAAQRL